MDKIIITFCEGQHDISFLSKILFVDGFTPYKKKIKDFIKPLNKQFETELSKKKIADKKLGFHSEYMLPSVALHRNEKILVLLHNLNGDSKITERKKILSMYQNIQSEEDGFSKEFNLNFRFIYFFDADNKGIIARVDELNSELKLDSKLEHNKICTINSDEWGCYVFHKDENCGDLEDILLDLMKPNNETIFENSLSFLKMNSVDESRQKEFTCNDREERYKSRVKFKEKKSIISVAGQLQFSSMSNSVIIAKSDYIKKSDISANSHCIEISQLFLQE